MLPHVPYRQWTLSFPHRVRWVLLEDVGLLSDVLTLFLRAVFVLRWMAVDIRLPPSKQPRCALPEGLSLHANTHQHANDRQGLRRTFALDVFACVTCGGQRRVPAYMMTPDEVRAILVHLTQPSQPPTWAPEQEPPQRAWCRVQRSCRLQPLPAPAREAGLGRRVPKGGCTAAPPTRRIAPLAPVSGASRPSAPASHPQQGPCLSYAGCPPGSFWRVVPHANLKKK